MNLRYERVPIAHPFRENDSFFIRSKATGEPSPSYRGRLTFYEITPAPPNHPACGHLRAHVRRRTSTGSPDGTERTMV